jgi:hypothetical protein
MGSLDAVEDLMNHPSFSGDFSRFAKGLPDLEVGTRVRLIVRSQSQRLVSRIHAGSCKQKDFRNVLEVRAGAILRATLIRTVIRDHPKSPHQSSQGCRELRVIERPWLAAVSTGSDEALGSCEEHVQDRK